MFKELVKHVGIHVSQHPKETLAAVAAAGKAMAPVAIAVAPYVAGAAVVGGIIYIISKKQPAM